MQVAKRPVFPIVLTLTAAALTGCDHSYDAVSASATPGSVDLGFDDPAYYVSLGHELRTSGRTDEAIKAFRRAIQIEIETAEAYDGLGTVFAEQRRLEEAIAAYRRALQIDPKNASAYRGLGKALAEQQRLGEAIAAYRESIEVDPTQTLAYSQLGDLLANQRRFPEAIKSYQQALNTSDKTGEMHVLALVGLGRALHAQQQWEDAIAMYEKAIQISPDSAWSYVFMGHTLAARDQLVTARETYQKAIKLPAQTKAAVGNSRAVAHNGLGVVLQRQGNTKGAIAQFEQAITLDRSYQAAQNNLTRAKQLLVEQSKPNRVVSKKE